MHVSAITSRFKYITFLLQSSQIKSKVGNSISHCTRSHQSCFSPTYPSLTATTALALMRPAAVQQQRYAQHLPQPQPSCMHIRFSNLFDNVGLGFRRFTSAHHKSTRQSFPNKSSKPLSTSNKSHLHQLLGCSQHSLHQALTHREIKVSARETYSVRILQPHILKPLIKCLRTGSSRHRSSCAHA